LNTHHAPPVSYAVGRSRLQAALLGLVLLSLTGLLVKWIHLDPAAGWRIWVEAIAVVGAAAIAVFGWKKTRCGDLVWDGDIWHWTDCGNSDGIRIGQLVVVADLQRFMVLEVTGEQGQKLYLWPERGIRTGPWLDFRRAIHGPVRVRQSPYAGEPPRADGASVAVSDEPELVGTARPPIHP
jgi:toxin CptA